MANHDFNPTAAYVSEHAVYPGSRWTRWDRLRFRLGVLWVRVRKAAR